jgi:DNA-directed RNA polymerase specialized sigma24 family protein
VVQEVFLTVYKGIRTFTKDGKPAAFRRWLYAITRFKVLDYWGDPEREFDGIGSWIDDVPDKRPRPCGASGSLPKDSSEISDGPVPKPHLPRLLELIRRDWCAFWQHEVEERSVEDVAKELGIPPCAVETSVSRVLKHLREVAEDGVPVRLLLLRRVLDLLRLEFEDPTFQAFWMVAAEGRSAQAVADLLGMPVGRVHTYKSRVRKRLKQELEALELLPDKCKVLAAEGAAVAQSEVKS